MLRAVGAFLVFLASAGMGCQESRKLSEHIPALEDYLQVIICLKGEIRYGGSSLLGSFLIWSVIQGMYLKRSDEVTKVEREADEEKAKKEKKSKQSKQSKQS